MRAKKIVTGILAAAAMCLCVAGAVRAQEDEQGAVLRFGVNPWGGEDEMRAMFRPLFDYIGEKLGVKIEIVIPASYDELLERTESGELDLMSFNAVTYLRALKKNMDIKYLGTMMRQDEGDDEPRDYYIGYIIVKKDSPYKTFEDLRGKKFAFVDLSSGSGYKMPLAILGEDYNTTPDDFFKKYFFVGDHDEVASAVYYGSVDGGATWDNSYDMNSGPDRFGKAFRIILKTPMIPNDAWVAGINVPEETAERIADIMLKIGPKTRTSDGRTVLDPDLGFPGTGWNRRPDSFYTDAAKYLLYKPK